MLSRKYKRHKKQRKEPLAKELKVQISLGLIPILLKLLEIILETLKD